MRKLSFIFAAAVLARGQDAVSLRDAVRQAMARSKVIAAADASRDAANARVTEAGGMASDADVLSIRVHLAGVREEQIRRSADLEVARAALNDASRLPLDTVRLLITPLAPLPVAQAELSRSWHCLRRGSDLDLRTGGGLVPIVPHSGDHHGCDSVFAGGHLAGARLAACVFHRDLNDWLHRGRGHRRQELNYPGGLHRAAFDPGDATGLGCDRCRSRALPSDDADGRIRGGWLVRDSFRPHFSGPGDRAHGR